MVNVCIELLIRIVLELWVFFKAHWLLVFIALGIISFITNRVGPLIIGLIASGLNLAIDTLLGATFGGSTLVSGVASIAIGGLWASIIFFSPINPLIKWLNVPFMFIIGFIWGFLPVPVPLALILAFLMRFRITNYIIVIIPGIVVIGLSYLVGPTTCSVVNSGIKFIS